MYYIIVYDINASRVNKVHKLLRQYLYWKQRSVFEGELTDKQLRELIRRLNRLIDENEDSICIYGVKSKALLNLLYLGVEPEKDEMII